MGSAEKRRDRRYTFRMPVVLVRGAREDTLLTGDVSHRGLFLRTDDPPPLRQLLQVKLKLPPDDDALSVHAMAVFLVPVGTAGRDPGVGLQFYAFASEPRLRWERFVHWVAKTHPEGLETPVEPGAAVPDPVKRQFPRVHRALTVRVQSMGDLHHLVTEDVSRGGMFLRTGLDVAIGSELRLFIVHPQTGLTFAVDAVVRHRADAPPDRAGLGVEFVGLDDRRREELAAFAQLDEAATGEDVVYVANEDPLLA